jgi:hypothetical protein
MVKKTRTADAALRTYLIWNMRHNTLCRLFNEIALLNHVPQSNRLDHVPTTKQLPWPWKGRVATLEDAEKERRWAVACFDAEVLGLIRRFAPWPLGIIGMATRLSEVWLVRDLGDNVLNEEPFETALRLQLSKILDDEALKSKCCKSRQRPNLETSAVLCAVVVS